jgi:hypothetical protein
MYVLLRMAHVITSRSLEYFACVCACVPVCVFHTYSFHISRHVRETPVHIFLYRDWRFDYFSVFIIFNFSFGTGHRSNPLRPISICTNYVITYEVMRHDARHRCDKTRHGVLRVIHWYACLAIFATSANNRRWLSCRRNHSRRVMSLVQTGVSLRRKGKRNDLVLNID